MGSNDQLDLFIDSPVAPMNPNKTHLKPDCFETRVQYIGWVQEAYRAKEQTYICEDCTNEFKAKMKALGRCHEEWTKEYGIVYKRSKVQEKNDEFFEILSSQKVRSSHKSHGSGTDKGSGPTTHGTDLQLFIKSWASGQGRDRQTDWVGPQSGSTQTA
jgi:hypothetical protein